MSLLAAFHTFINKSELLAVWKVRSQSQHLFCAFVNNKMACEISSTPTFKKLNQVFFFKLEIKKNL